MAREVFSFAHVVPKSFVSDGGTGTLQSAGKSASVYAGMEMLSGISTVIDIIFTGSF
jgi:hypothetical protein